MWVLSLLILALAASIYLRDRKVEPPTIAFVTGMLFALPAVRNVQPGVPGIGSTADVVGFFWNMMMVALAAALLLVNYIRKYKGDNCSRNESPDAFSLDTSVDTAVSIDNDGKDKGMFSVVRISGTRPEMNDHGMRVNSSWVSIQDSVGAEMGEDRIQDEGGVPISY
jgi:hypothetical protein